MENYSQEEIQNLQDSLYVIRKAGGWTAEQFGDLLDITKQSVRNLETHVSKMSLTQYIAIRSVLDYQIEHHPENELLKKTVQLTLCSGDLSPEDKEKAKAAANYMVNLSDTGKDKSFIYSSLVAILGVGLCGIIMSILPPLFVFIMKLFRSC